MTRPAKDHVSFSTNEEIVNVKSVMTTALEEDNPMLFPATTDDGADSDPANFRHDCDRQIDAEPQPMGCLLPPAALGVGQLKAMFRVLLTLGREGSTVININGEARTFVRKDPSVSHKAKTYHFRAREHEYLFLYWFEQYGAIMTPDHLYVEFCKLSSGDVIVGVWETRCDRPFHAILVYHIHENSCELFTVSDFRSIHPDVTLDPAGTFDREKAATYVL
jgi:hypothetical protein